MDALVVGGLAAWTVALATLNYYALIAPQRLLALFRSSEDDASWLSEEGGAISAMRFALGVAVFLSGFLTGLATVFLASTQ